MQSVISSREAWYHQDCSETSEEAQQPGLELTTITSIEKRHNTAMKIENDSQTIH